METEYKNQDIGHELGYEGVDRLVDQVEGVCVHERQRIELTNQSRILGLRAELSIWADQERSISARIRVAPPPGDLRSRRRKAWFAGVIAFLLTIAGFFFSLLAFDPFRLGWKSYLYCVGIAIVSPFAVEKFLEEWDSRKLIKGMVTVACAAAIASLVLLAVIRGDLFSQQLKELETPVLITGDSPVVPQSDNHFYDETLPLLQFVMALLAVAMELGAGLALHDAKRLGANSGEDFHKLSKEFIEVRLRMAAIMDEIKRLSNEGGVFEARFWRDFYRAMLTHTTRKALGKLLALTLCLVFVGLDTTRADSQCLNLVVAIDLTASVASKGPDGKTDFEKNVAAVIGLLGEVPSGSRVTVLGITGDSFAEPDILISAQVPNDPGYFGERLSAARRQLVSAWQGRSAHLIPNASRTDILGALLVTGQLFQERSGGGRKVLVIYSDMRQATPALNLETPAAVPVNSALIKVGKASPVPDLEHVEVYALGVDAAGKEPAHWDSLRQFWANYFQMVSASLRSYSTLREPPAL
jgi:hypothetical protein